MHRYARAAVGLLALLAAGALLWPWLPEIEVLGGWLESLRGGGPSAVVVFVAVYAVATLAMVPASWIQGTAGFLFGPVWGIVFASIASTGFGTVSFLLARTVLREPLSRRLRDSERLHAVDDAVGDGGVSLVVLLRLSPLSPYNVVNYMLGLTRVSLREYVLGTWLGSLVPVVLYGTVGASVGDLTALLAGEANGPGWVQWVGMITTVIVTLGVTAFAKRTLNRALVEA